MSSFVFISETSKIEEVKAQIRLKR